MSRHYRRRSSCIGCLSGIKSFARALKYYSSILEYDRNSEWGLNMTGRMRANGVRSIAIAFLLAIVLSALAAVVPGDRTRGNAGDVRNDAVPRAGVHLIMVELAGCPYCARWDREIGISYGASPEGRFAPLVRLPRNHPALSAFADSIYSPTFIVVQDGVEIGRIVGYPGADFFWGLLDRILAQAGFKPESSGS